MTLEMRRRFYAEEIAATKVSSAVTGGASRSESVRLALEDVPEEAVVVLVHDAARPLLPEAVIERVLAPLSRAWDGVVPALPLADTVKRVDGDRVTETLPRADLVAVQTPQAFLADVLRRAVAGDVAGATDCSSLVEASGGVDVVLSPVCCTSFIAVVTGCGAPG